jgi:RNA methyltransferase, TrmH family
MKLDDVRKLQQKKFRDLLGHFVVEGEHLILELQKAARQDPALRRAVLYVTREHAGWESPFETHVIADHQMKRISDTRNPQGMVAVVPALIAPAPREGERAVYLNEVQDPGNLGTILRSLAWFGAFRCLLSPDSVDPYNAKVVRASMGAIFHVPIETDVALDSLPDRFARIAALDMQGEPPTSSDFRHCDCYVFGNEARGLPRASLAKLGAQTFTIPGCGAIESLNLASVVGMCLYELNR